MEPESKPGHSGGRLTNALLLCHQHPTYLHDKTQRLTYRGAGVLQETLYCHSFYGHIYIDTNLSYSTCTAKFQTSYELKQASCRTCTCQDLKMKNRTALRTSRRTPTFRQLLPYMPLIILVLVIAKQIVQTHLGF